MERNRIILEGSKSQLEQTHPILSPSLSSSLLLSPSYLFVSITSSNLILTLMSPPPPPLFLPLASPLPYLLDTLWHGSWNRTEPSSSGHSEPYWLQIGIVLPSKMEHQTRKENRGKERKRRGGKEGMTPSKGWWWPIEAALCRLIGLDLIRRDRERGEQGYQRAGKVSELALESRRGCRAAKKAPMEPFLQTGMRSPYSFPFLKK